VAKKGMLYTQTGTPYYASPEVWKNQPYDSKSDIWSLGCVLYEIVALHPPFLASNMKGLYEKIISGKYMELPSKYSNELHLVINTMLQLNPKLRPACGNSL
jgi:NIMA (never in mitosis gene a)-related kinase